MEGGSDNIIPRYIFTPGHSKYRFFVESEQG